MRKTDLWAKTQAVKNVTNHTLHHLRSLGWQVETVAPTFIQMKKNVGKEPRSQNWKEIKVWWNQEDRSWKCEYDNQLKTRQSVPGDKWEAGKWREILSAIASP